MQNYISLKQPLNAFINAEQILNKEDIQENYLPCEVIGLCFYKNEVITFLVKLSDGEVFSYIPTTAIQITKNPSNIVDSFNLKELCFMNCPSDLVRVNHIDQLNGKVSVFLKDKPLWIEGNYIATIDFYEDNELLNLVELENGLLAFVPFHKMKFKPLSKVKQSFIPYKKQRKNYSL